MKTISGSLAERVRIARRQIKLSQQGLAEVSGVSKRAIQSIEEGKVPNPQIETLKALAGALKTPVGYLAGESETLTDAKKALLLSVIDQLEPRAVAVLLSVASSLLNDASFSTTVKNNKRLR